MREISGPYINSEQLTIVKWLRKRLQVILHLVSSCAAVLHQIPLSVTCRSLARCMCWDAPSSHEYVLFVGLCVSDACGLTLDAFARQDRLLENARSIGNLCVIQVASYRAAPYCHGIGSDEIDERRQWIDKDHESVLGTSYSSIIPVHGSPAELAKDTKRSLLHGL